MTPIQASNAIRAADPEATTLDDLKEFARFTYVGHRGWQHDANWSDATKRSISEEAAAAARKMRADIEDLKIRARAAESLSDIAATAAAYDDEIRDAAEDQRLDDADRDADLDDLGDYPVRVPRRSRRSYEDE